MSLQKSKNTFKLSERTVVEIIMKIGNRGKVKLLHTTSGKEYVVNEKVNIEILNEIKKRKRITIYELSSYLELPINIIENKVNDLISKNKNYLLLDGKIMTKEYLDKITKEINEIVIKQGSAAIAEISNKYDLSIDFLKSLLKDKINEGILNAKLYPTRIITDYYIKNQIKKIRPLLLANINPIFISKILTKDKDIDELLIDQVINTLIDSKQVKGSFMSNTFENLVYSKAQEEYVVGEINQNNYLDFNKIKNIGINKNGKEFIKALIKTREDIKGIFLKDYFITDELKSNLALIINENESKCLPTNLESELLLNLDEEDINSLLESMKIQERNYIYINFNYIPIKIIEQFIENSQKSIIGISENIFNEYTKKIEDEKSKEEKIPDKEEEIPKKKKGGKSSKSNKDKNIENKNNYDIKFPKEQEENFLNCFMELACFEYINDKRETLKDIYYNNVFPKLKSLFDEQIKNLIKIKEKQKNQIDINSHVKILDNTYLYLKLINENLSKIENQFTTEEEKRALKILITHLCRNELNVFLKDLMIYEMSKNNITIDIHKLNSCNEREKIINQIQSQDERLIFNQLSNKVEERNLLCFMEELEKYINLKNIVFSSFDGNKEKEQINKIIIEIKKEIKDPNKALQDSKNYFRHLVFLLNYFLIKKDLYFKLPNEFWIFSACKIIFEIPIFKLGDELDCILNDFFSLIKDKKDSQLGDLFNENKQKFTEILEKLQENI